MDHSRSLTSRRQDICATLITTESWSMPQSFTPTRERSSLEIRVAESESGTWLRISQRSYTMMTTRHQSDRSPSPRMRRDLLQARTMVSASSGSQRTEKISSHCKSWSHTRVSISWSVCSAWMPATLQHAHLIRLARSGSWANKWWSTTRTRKKKRRKRMQNSRRIKKCSRSTWATQSSLAMEDGYGIVTSRVTTAT